MAAPGTHPGVIRFGPFEIDCVNRELSKRGNVVKLQPQQFAVLLLLVERAGQIVSREEIHQHIWGNDTFVDFERGINFSINQIRAALGDDAERPRFVETIPRRGYRFIAPINSHELGVTDVPNSTSLDPLPAAPPQPLSAKKILIGLSMLAILAAGFLGYRSLCAGTPQIRQPGRHFQRCASPRSPAFPAVIGIRCFLPTADRSLTSGMEETGAGGIFTCS